jgi:hypothetical protein
VIAILLLHEEDVGGGGGGDAAAVLNDQLNGALIAFPAESLTPDIVAVYDVEAERDDAGLNVALLPPVNDTVPETVEPALFFRTNVEVVTVELCTASLNVAETVDETDTPVAPANGEIVDTVGGALSADVELPTYSKGSRILSCVSPVKYPRPFPSQTFEGVDPEAIRALRISAGDALGLLELYKAAAPVT